MTLIAFSTSPSSADIITDTLAYTHCVENLGQNTKTFPVIHLDAAMAVQGDGAFATLAQVMVLSETTAIESFDRLVAWAPDRLQNLWERVQEDRGKSHIYNSTVYLVGYSDAESSFVGYSCSAEDDFVPERCEGLHLFPMPWSHRPSRIEALRFTQENVPLYGQDVVDEFLQGWNAAPPAPLPKTIEDWIALADYVRVSRALHPQFKVLVGGRLIHTRLRRNQCSTAAIHQFNDTGAEFLQLVAYTGHSLGGKAPCACGSGESIEDCRPCRSAGSTQEAPQTTSNTGDNE